MRKGPFVARVAKATGVEEVTVKTVARRLSEAGDLTSTGARGVNGPDMVPRDAARLLQALWVTDAASKAVDASRGLGALVVWPGADTTKEALEALTNAGLPCSNGETFEDALTALLTPGSHVEDRLEIKVRSNRRNDAVTCECSFRRHVVNFSVWDINLVEKMLSGLKRTADLAAAQPDKFKAEIKRLRAAPPELRPGTFSDSRTLSGNTLLWLRKQVFENAVEGA